MLRIAVAERALAGYARSIKQRGFLGKLGHRADAKPSLSWTTG